VVGWNIIASGNGRQIRHLGRSLLIRRSASVLPYQAHSLPVGLALSSRAT
jgi:hypothetical protein